eukprot:3715573-Rhodomonas_salina.1
MPEGSKKWTVNLGKEGRNLCRVGRLCGGASTWGREENWGRGRYAPPPILRERDNQKDNQN